MCEQCREKRRLAKGMVAIAIEPANTGVSLFNRMKEEQRCSR